jgi:hypothetical protein
MSFAFASEIERVIETYCFPSEASRVRVEKKLTGILLPSDKLASDKSCITVQMRPHRRELIQNFASSLDPDMAVTFSSAEIKRESCALQVEKIRALNIQNSNIEISKLPGATEGQRTESSKDVMQIETLDKFSFTVSQDAIEGNCRYINKDLYEITISARRDPKPVVPPNLPPGTIVVVATPPPDQKTLNISTNIQLTRGSRIEIGRLVRDLRKKDHDVSIKPEAQIESSEQKEEEKVFLSLQ